jgi:hypothetical protein
VATPIWTQQLPRSVIPIEQAGSLCITDSARTLARVYRKLTQANDVEMPHKNDLDLSLFAGTVNNLFLFAITKPDQCIVRLAADGARHHSGAYQQHSDYYANVPEGRLQVAVRAMNMAIDIPCGFRADIRHDYEHGRTRDFESLLLPLLSGEEGVDGFLIGSSQLSGDDAGKVLPSERSLGNNILTRDLVDLVPAQS